MTRLVGIILGSVGAVVVALALVATLLWAHAFGGPGSAPDGSVNDYTSLVSHLQATGAMVIPQPAPQTKFWGNATAYTVLLNGERVDVYQFNTTLDATSAAGQMSADGSQQRTGPFSMAEIDWVAPPHFFRANRVIAIYIGRSEAALTPLHQVMGAPFAEERG